MKKNVLALSITAALVGLTGGAHAMTGTLGGASATVQEFNGQGVGHSLIIPYFTTQGANNTLINIVNTDLANGKAVKVRFRGAANSDDVFDFQVFLSPGDVYAVNVAQGSDGKSRLTTNDVSCTKPDRSVLNGASFLTARLDQTMTAAQQANGTREGYVEIFNMGDIPKASILAAAVDAPAADIAAGVAAAGVNNPLYTAIKHVANVAPCSSSAAPGTAASAAAWAALDTVNLQFGGPAATTPVTAGLLTPTTGLMANWTIVNVVGAAAWSGEAVAVEARDAVGVVATSPTLGVVGERVNRGNVVYWPQTTNLVDAAGVTTVVETYSADALFRTANVYTASGSSGAITTMAVAAAGTALPASFYDLPDMSTPYIVGATPLTQAASLTASLATRSVRNEFFTDTGVSATTDWLFSMPTRRYSVGFDYNFTGAPTATNDGRRFTNITGDGTPGAVSSIAYFNAQNTTVTFNTNFNGRQVCVAPATTVGFVLSQQNREETRPTGAAPGVVISPSPIINPNKVQFCGEASVLSINNGGIVPTGTGSLKAVVAVQDADLTYRDGWMTVLTPAAVGPTLIGLPVIGSSFSRALGNAGGQTFGISSQHRFQR